MANPQLDIEMISESPENHDVSNPLEVLQGKLESHTAVVGVVGLGYVGLPIAVAYSLQGYRTLGIDLDQERVSIIQSGESCIQDVGSSEISEIVGNGAFSAHADYQHLSEADVIFICVPTPVTEHKDPDTSYIKRATESIARSLRAGQLIILKSTTYPNTTEELVLPILSAEGDRIGLTVGEDFAVAFSPERVDPGNKDFQTENTPIVVGGVTPACTNVAAAALKKIVGDVHSVSSPRVAEMTKLLENIFRSVNIALANELARLCDRIGNISMWEVVEAAKTKPFGFMPFYPGPGLGGHCIPIDPYYLSWLARRYDFETSFITLSARVNEDMPFYVADAVLRAIASRPVSLGNASALILGVAFKKDVDDTRHSPAEKIMEILSDAGIGHLNFSDPHVPSFNFSTADGPRRLESQPVSEELLAEQDVVVIVTDHSAFPYELLNKCGASIVDTRNALEDVRIDDGRLKLLGGGQF